MGVTESEWRELVVGALADTAGSATARALAELSGLEQGALAEVVATWVVEALDPAGRRSCCVPAAGGGLAVSVRTGSGGRLYRLHGLEAGRGAMRTAVLIGAAAVAAAVVVAWRAELLARLDRVERAIDALDTRIDDARDDALNEVLQLRHTVERIRPWTGLIR